jgi:uncharacterized protein
VARAGEALPGPTFQLKMNAPAFFEVQADDPVRAAHFYGAIFNWKFAKVEGLPVEYWRIETEGPRGGLLRRPAAPPALGSGTNAFVCSMEVRSFDQVAGQITSLGGRVAAPKFAVPGVCWQAYFIDTEGNTFGIFEPDSNAR